jgi:methenyltetrahydromethanopterin cyclohydrolase
MIGELNAWGVRRFHELTVAANRLRIEASEDNRVLDMGVGCCGGLEAGLALAEICMGGLGRVSISVVDSRVAVAVRTDQPALACMGSQYGGWPVKYPGFFAIGSGPARLCRGREPVLEQYGFREKAEQVVVVLESGKIPGNDILPAMASECGVAREGLLVCVAPTRSIAGTIQIVARVIESVMHKLFELGFDIQRVTCGCGTAPLPPTGGDDLLAIGRTNDAILYGGRVRLWIDADGDEIEALGPKVPSNSSPSWGLPFAEMFRASGNDFYKLDPMLFSAARVEMISNRDGSIRVFGELNPQLAVPDYT